VEAWDGGAPPLYIQTLTGSLISALLTVGLKLFDWATL